MGQYIVLHMEKRREISPVLERHIFRLEIRYVDGVRTETVWTPDNANPEKANLNEELVSMKSETPEGKEITLTINQAIRKRLNEAGIKKVRKDQNTAIEIILTGSPETMNNLSEEELKKWVEESMKWARKQWGKDNIVSAVLHRDEKTPHIHIILVPLVTGQSRRTASKEKKLAQQGITKKNYNVDNKRLRLSANEVYTQPRLYGYHTSYAKEVGEKFGLQRGIQAEAGSKKKHQTSEEYNRQLERERREQQELIDTLKSDYSEKEKNLEQINADIEIAQGALNIANQKRKIAEARKGQAEIDAATKEAQVKELETKSSSLSGEITTKEKRVSQLKGVIDYNVKVIHKQLSDFNARKQQIDEQEGLIKENSDTISSQQDDIEDIRQFLKLFKDAERKAEQKENYLKSISSMGLLKMIQSIPELIKADVQEKVKGYWKGTVQSFEKVRYPIEDGEEEDFIKVNMRNNETNHDYFFEVRVETGDVYYNGNSEVYTWPKTGETMYMSRLASYFRDEINAEAMQIVESLYKRPVQTNEVVWNCSLGLEKTRIVQHEDGRYELQQQQYSQGIYVWSKITAFKDFKEVGKDNTYAFLKVTRSNGQEEYINQYGNNLTGKQLKSLGIKSGNGRGL